MSSGPKTNAPIPNRRDWLKQSLPLGAGAALSSAGVPMPSLAAPTGSHSIQAGFEDLRYCFNTASLRGAKLPVQQLVDLVAQAGYQGIEVWIDELDRHVTSGGTLRDLKKRCDDHGLKVESAIAFANWLAPDPETAKQEREKAKRDMDKVAALGGRCIAAPPAGQNAPISDWELAAQRLDELAAVGKETGVQPQLEVWGFSQAIGNLSQAMKLATAASSPDFGILLDVYHLYKGGSPMEGLRLVAGSSMKLFHMNDYPDAPPRAEISDADRVFPGDGVAPISAILQTLVATGFRGALSLELFNQDYWKQEPQWVVATGLAKMKSAVAAAAGD